MTTLSRRNFLKLGSAVFAVSILPHGLARAEAVMQPAPTPLGRIASGWRQPVRKEAKLAGEIAAYKAYDEIIPLLGQVEGEAPWPTNPYWFKTDEGYIHTAFVQPVQDTPSGTLLKRVDAPGAWLQVCVPIAATRQRLDSKVTGRKLYYGTVYRAVEAVQNADGDWFYRLQDGIAYAPGPYVPASAMRFLSPADLSALGSSTNKRIEVKLDEQVLTCYEDDTPVFSTRTATGFGSNFTPRGEYRIIRKRFTSYMIGGEGNDYYNLPGVAFPSYFTASAIAVHGTYWHNDFGRPKSHGCVNVDNEAARFVFRWTEPFVPYGEAGLAAKKGEGTLVQVI